ncbi:MAG TPA: hypothetical protein VGR47_01125 [Terracidiphilus sp.]|nr:hypothetical protein [Terracidiphilus sp.]
MVVTGQAHATEMYIEGIPFTSPGGQDDPRLIWPAFGVQTLSQFRCRSENRLGWKGGRIDEMGAELRNSIFTARRGMACRALV